MRALRKAYVDVPAGQIHYHAIDGIEPAILFLHQTALSAKSYDALLPVLDLPNRLIAFDTPGFGGSFDADGWPTLETYAAWIAEAATALSIERFHIFGHHTGASLAIELAAAWPERVLSIMLAGPVFFTPEERASFIAGYRDPITPQRDGSHLLTNWTYSTRHNPDLDVATAQVAVTDLLRAWRGRPQAYMAVAHHDTEARARTITAPVLLLTAPGDFFHAIFERARTIFPDAATAATGGDNFPMTVDPEGVARAVETFLETGFGR